MCSGRALQGWCIRAGYAPPGAIHPAIHRRDTPGWYSRIHRSTAPSTPLLRTSPPQSGFLQGDDHGPGPLRRPRRPIGGAPPLDRSAQSASTYRTAEGRRSPDHRPPPRVGACPRTVADRGPRSHLSRRAGLRAARPPPRRRRSRGGPAHGSCPEGRRVDLAGAPWRVEVGGHRASRRRRQGTTRAPDGSRPQRPGGHRRAAGFVAEVRESGCPSSKAASLRFDEAVERFLTEHLRDEKGREDNTIRSYRAVHHKWFAPHIGSRLVRDIDEATLDRLFGRMRAAGLSRSSLRWWPAGRP